MLKNLLIILLLFASVFSHAQNKKWKKCKSCEDIKVVYSQIGPADYEVSINTIINANLKDVVAVISDIESYPNWLYNCILVDELEPRVDSKGLIYALISAPFPMKDIEMFLSYAVKPHIDDNSIMITQNVISDYSPPNEKFQRVTRYSAVWKIVQLQGDKVGLFYHVKMGVPKNLPKFILKVFLCSGPGSTIEDFARVCEAK